MLKKKSGYTIKSLRSDRGGEFTSKEFEAYCEENGIHRPLMVPYSSQQNGVAKRRNRTILDMVICLLKSKGIPKQFWAETANCAIYILNRCPTKGL